MRVHFGSLVILVVRSLRHNSTGIYSVPRHLSSRLLVCLVMCVYARLTTQNSHGEMYHMYHVQ